jgi:hypothetical protein
MTTRAPGHAGDMSTATVTAREVHLVRRPHGMPDPDDFALVDRELGEPGAGEVLVANQAFSVDPYMRGRMNDVPSYVPPFALDEPMDGRAVGEVIASNSGDVAVGDVVTSNLAWRTHGVVPAKQVQKVAAPEGVDPTAYLGVLACRASPPGWGCSTRPRSARATRCSCPGRPARSAASSGSSRRSRAPRAWSAAPGARRRSRG